MQGHKNKTIVIVGVLDHEGSTNIFMAKAFKNFGYDVFPVNYRTLAQRYGMKAAQEAIVHVAMNVKPALVLFSKCNGIDSSIIGTCGRHAKTWFWFMDGINTLKTVWECVSHAQLADFASCTGLGVAKHICAQTQSAVHHIMEGIDPEYYRNVGIVPEYSADISFIGAANKQRVEYLTSLSNEGYDVKAYGPGFNREVNGFEFNAICSSSKMMLAISAEHDTDQYFSDRVFRYGACNSFVLHRHSPQMENFFDNTELVYFNNTEGLLQCAKEYVNNNEARGHIANNLYNKVLKNHTWDRTIHSILHIIGEIGE
jgi:spore maturation protein CgeB